MKSTETFATTYVPHEGRCFCSCGWDRRVTSDADADRLLAEHTTAHELLIAAGVA